VVIQKMTNRTGSIAQGIWTATVQRERLRKNSVASIMMFEWQTILGRLFICVCVEIHYAFDTPGGAVANLGTARMLKRTASKVARNV
jgi:hypothetical protein